MNPLYEKYFHGEMSGDERRRLEQEIAQNPDMQTQFEADQELADLLKGQMLRRKITTILAEPGIPAPQSGNKAKRWWAGLGLAGLLLVSWLVWKNFSGNVSSEPPSTPPQSIPQQNQQVQPSVPIVVQPPTPPEPKTPPEKQQEKQPELIAEVPVEAHSLQGMRGNEGGRTAWGLLVEKIWYAPFTAAPDTFGERFKPAAVALSKGNTADAFLLLRKLPANDTLAFLKGYCLMEMWEGKTALRSFDGLFGKPHSWAAEVEWYNGLCHLLAGEKNEAIKVFKKIAAQPKHAYRKPANNALELLN